MPRLRAALAASILLGALALPAAEAGAMPVLTPVSLAGQASDIESAYYGYGWRRPVYRRGFYGYGWRRPYGWRGYGWHRGWRNRRLLGSRVR